MVKIIDTTVISGVNTGDQTSIVGITGTKSEFNTAVTDGDILYVGDIAQYTDELAQDAVGTILTDSSEIDFTYNDAAPSITASLVAGSIDETKLDVSVNASLDLADTAAQNTFQTIAVSGQSDVVADSATDTLTLVAGSNITITTDAGTDTITIAASGGGGGVSLPIEISDVTDLSTELSGKAASSHTHSISDITATGTADSTTYLRGDGTWATPAGGGGGDPWTYVKLESDYTNSTTTISNTALTFTPESNKQYLIEGIILAHSSINTNAARFGINFGTGYTYGAANLTAANGTTSVIIRNARTGNTDANNCTTNTAHPATGQIYAHTIWGTVIYGGSAGGAVTIQGRSEIATNITTFKAGSFIRYREI